MKRTLTFLMLFVKRLCKKPSFLIILLLMPVLVLGLRLVLQEDDETIYIALLNESGDEKIDHVIADLVSSDGTMCYYEADNEEDLRADVLTQYAECGFVFREGVWESLVKEEESGLITLYQNSKTTMADLIKEKIFANIYSYLSYDLMLEYLGEQEFEDGLTNEEREKYLEEKYQLYVNEGGVFTISYMDGDNTIVKDVEEVASDNSFLMKPVKGVLALFTLMASLAGAVFWAIDEKEGVYKTLGYTERPYVNLTVIFLPGLLAGAMALISVWLGGISQGIFVEIGRTLAYVILLTGFSNLIRSMTSNATLICSILPMLTVASLICCNIIINTASMVEGIKYVRILLPPNYYLEMNSLSDGLITAGLGFGLIAIGILVDRKKNS